MRSGCGPEKGEREAERKRPRAGEGRERERTSAAAAPGELLPDRLQDVWMWRSASLKINKAIRVEDTSGVLHIRRPASPK